MPSQKFKPLNHLTIVLVALSILCSNAFAQKLGLTFQEAKKQGISINALDSIYKSAVHVDSSKAVFKTDDAQKALYEAYVELLTDLGKFLSANNFKWDEPTRCFNRVYFSNDGTVDYFLFNFLGQPEEKPSEEKQEEFEELLNRFIKDYQFSLTADEKFAQCSPVTYMPPKE